MKVILSKNEMMELILRGYASKNGSLSGEYARVILRLINRKFSAVILTGADNKGQDEFNEDLEEEFNEDLEEEDYGQET